jgi:hypothetical protein
MAQKTFTRQEVAKNNTAESLWFVIDSKVYDVTDFLDAHPGGEAVLKQVAGTDATDAFYNLHRQEVLQKYSNLCIGTIDGEKPKVIEQHPGDLSLVPYGEPTWLTPQFKSPYYKESHRRLQKAMRIWTDTELYPVAQECEKTGELMSDKWVLCTTHGWKIGLQSYCCAVGTEISNVSYSVLLQTSSIRTERFNFPSASIS